MDTRTTVSNSSRAQMPVQIDSAVVSRPTRYVALGISATDNCGADLGHALRERDDGFRSANAMGLDYGGPRRQEFISYSALWRVPVPQGRIYQSVTVTSPPDAMGCVYCRIGEGVGLVHLRDLAGAE